MRQAATLTRLRAERQGIDMPTQHPSSRLALSVDIGGTGIKGAPVDLDSGHLTKERIKVPTPAHSTPDAVGEVVTQLLDQIGVDGVGAENHVCPNHSGLAAVRDLAPTGCV
jgi:polyphosphate glucokinase